MSISEELDVYNIRYKSICLEILRYTLWHHYYFLCEYFIIFWVAVDSFTLLQSWKSQQILIILIITQLS